MKKRRRKEERHKVSIELLSLYNAAKNTQYTSLTITTFEDDLEV